MSNRRQAVHIHIPKCGGTTVTLTHYGWREGEDWAKVREYFESAWTRVMESLTKHLGEGSGANPANDRKIDYVEFAVADIGKAKAFHSAVSGWKFTDYGPDYTSFEDGRLAGGFRLEEEVRRGGPLVVVYGLDLEAVEASVRANGGTIVQGIFSFRTTPSIIGAWKAAAS